MNDFRAEYGLIERLFLAGIAAVEPKSAMIRAIPDIDIAPDGRLIVVAVGKAAQAMAEGAVECLGTRIDSGFILTKDGHLGTNLSGFEAFEASHPVPDQRGFDATMDLLDLVQGLERDDTVLALISGGGSALLEAPLSPITLDDIQTLTDALLRAGAPIQDLNAVRSAISRVKRGGLRRAIGPARCISLILSDVLGNDPGVIASGPTIAAASGYQAALAVIDAYGLREGIPGSVLAVLESSSPSQPYLDDRDTWKIIGDNRAMLDAVAVAASVEGQRAAIVWEHCEGEARKLGRDFASLPFPDDVDIMIGGGEATVTVRGQGIGGRNTEFALAAAFGLRGRVIASLASDGDDGSAGAAGAIVDPDSISRGRDLGLDAVASLDRNDSAAYVGAIGGLIRTGPTGTNVNDLYLAIRAERGTR